MMQCKDIPDEPILRFLLSDACLIGDSGTHWGLAFEGYPNSVQNAMPLGTPNKLAVAKMGQLIHRGLVDGCCCGCRGDFEVTEKGRASLAAGHQK